ncbi:MAG: hypothetical protein JST54_23470 [Deltaproteobacteria bacterium]|nr:hypothetical protein [Deltaproteobacteria bacterium]
MKRVLLTAVVLALAACGNYSNDDIAFYDALPNQQALQVNVPQTQQGALTQTASLYSGTVVTAETINNGVESIIALVDLIRTIAPSARTDDSRTWGPFPDKNPAFEVQVVITRSGDTFTYSFEERKKGQGTFTPVLTGTFAGATAVGGHGTLDYEPNVLVGLGNPPADPNLLSLKFVYANDATPRTVNTTIVGRDATSGQTATLSYEFSETTAEGDLDFDFVVPTGIGPFDLHLVSKWIADGGQGRCIGTGTLDLIPGVELTVDQCWDSHFQETWYDSHQLRLDGGPPLMPPDSPGLDCDAGAGLSLACPRGNEALCPF